MYEGTLAAITVNLISGSIVERMKFETWLIFSILWGVCVYPVITHWVWSENGFLYELGFIDYAGGSVIHISAGVSALVLCIQVGKRNSFYDGN